MMRYYKRGIVKPVIVFSVGMLTFILHKEILQYLSNDRNLSKIETTPYVPFVKKTTKSLSELNMAYGLSDHILMFNRIPKSGSEIFVLLLQKLQGITFSHIRLKNDGVVMMNYSSQKTFVKEISETIREKAIPLSFDKMVFFTNFTEFGFQSPMYFNIIRDPFENYKLRMVTELITLNNEVPYDFSIPYFCGHRFDCTKLNNKYALNEAKYIVDRYYPVVGLLEYFNETVLVLKDKLPLFFKNAKLDYINTILDSRKKWLYTPIQATLPGIVEKYLSTEYDFYKWIKMRLLYQYNTIEGKKKTTFYEFQTE